MNVDILLVLTLMFSVYVVSVTRLSQAEASHISGSLSGLFRFPYKGFF